MTAESVISMKNYDEVKFNNVSFCDCEMINSEKHTFNLDYDYDTD